MNLPQATHSRVKRDNQTLLNRLCSTAVCKNFRIGSHRDYRLMGWLLIALLGCFLAYVSRMHRIDHDAFHEMSLFREWLVTEQFPVNDVFAYTPTKSPAVHHEWGTGAILYFVTIGTGMGAMGLAILRLLLIAALWLLLYRVARMRGAHPIVFAFTSLIVFPTLWVGFATIRAQLFTLVFIAAQLWMQEQDCRGRRGWILLWLAMLAAWLNMHAGFVVGIGMLTIHFLERFIGSLFQFGWRKALQNTWHMIAAVPPAVGLLWLNPYGGDYIPYLIHAIRMPRPLVIEWQPLWNNYAPELSIAAFVTSVLLFAYCLRQLKSLSRMRGAVSLAICSYMALRHIRHGSIFSIVWIAYVPAWLSRTPIGKGLVTMFSRKPDWVVRGCQVVTAATLGFATFHHIWMPSLPSTPVYSSSCYPSEAVEYLRQHRFQGNVLTTFQDGSFVSWQLYPHVKVSLDSRYEVAFDDSLVQQHVNFGKVRGPQWWQVLQQYPTDLALIPTNDPVYQHLDQLQQVGLNSDSPIPDLEHNWQIIYRDDSYVILASDHWAERLPVVDKTNQELPNRVDQVFSKAVSHWSLRQQ